jgi:glutaredoxin-related protein
MAIERVLVRVKEYKIVYSGATNKIKDYLNKFVGKVISRNEVTSFLKKTYPEIPSATFDAGLTQLVKRYKIRQITIIIDEERYITYHIERALDYKPQKLVGERTVKKSIFMTVRRNPKK